MSELIDVVDENDEVIATLERAVIHQSKVRHRAAHLLILNQEKNIFLQKRAATKEMFPGCWDSSVAGHVESGESYITCIMRECQEELGVVTNASLQSIAKVQACEENGWEFITLFLMIHNGPFELNEEEISEGAWFELEEVRANLKSRPHAFAGGFEQLFRLAFL